LVTSPGLWKTCFRRLPSRFLPLMPRPRPMVELPLFMECLFPFLPTGFALYTAFSNGQRCSDGAPIVIGPYEAINDSGCGATPFLFHFSRRLAIPAFSYALCGPILLHSSLSSTFRSNKPWNPLGVNQVIFFFLTLTERLFLIDRTTSSISLPFHYRAVPLDSLCDFPLDTLMVAPF